MELKKELEKLKKENVGLKAKWQSKVEMISRVRENFGSGQKRSGEEEGSGSKRRLRFNKEEGRWEEESEEEDESTNDQVRINNNGSNEVIRKQQL